MTGAWVVRDSVCEGYGGFDQIFATEADARGWLDAPERDRDRKNLKGHVRSVGELRNRGGRAMTPHAELSDARAELIAVAVEWHEGKQPDQRLHDAAERYQTLRDAYLDSLWSRT